MAGAVGTHLVDAASTLATSSELDLFSVPDTQISIDSGFWVIIPPRNNMDNRGPWEFDLDTGPHYAKLTKNYMYLKLRIFRTDGGVVNIDNAQDAVGPINMIGSTFFKTVKLYIGGKLISDSNDLYAYRSLLESELSYNANCKDSGHLMAALYSQDRPHNHMTDAQNQGWIERRTWFDGSQEVEIMAPVHVDLFKCAKLIPTHTKIHLQMYRHDDAFCLKNYQAVQDAAGLPIPIRTYELRVTEMKWHVRLVDLSKATHVALESTLSLYTAKYPIDRIQMARISIPANSDRTPHHTVFQGQIPRRITFGCVRRDAFNGSRTLNPFMFENFGIKQVTVTAGGITYNRDPLKTDFEHNVYLRAYLQLMESLGNGYPSTKTCAITPSLFKAGFCLFAFDLTPDDEPEGQHWELTRQGGTILEILFEPMLAHPIEIIVYGEFDSMIRLDRNREAITSFLL
jgi:hypothetical protein